ncbi:hypothetical protein [Amycolatopsis sp. VC5-11]|uniref:hypothetical protein n=1 Tax=Amycolatopsis sp. VC5-11 TaxID=3120156 RepID=UPI00300B526C
MLELKGTTSIVSTTVRIVGEVETRLDVHDAGTPLAVVRLMLGSVLVNVHGALAVERVAKIWQDAGFHRDRLASEVTDPRRGLLIGGCQVGTVARIGPDAPSRCDLIPRTKQLPQHIRIQIGPLIWLVMDRAAYDSTRAAWDQATKLAR